MIVKSLFFLLVILNLSVSQILHPFFRSNNFKSDLFKFKNSIQDENPVFSHGISLSNLIKNGISDDVHWMKFLNSLITSSLLRFFAFFF